MLLYYISFTMMENNQTPSGFVFSLENVIFTIFGGVASAIVYALLTYIWNKPTLRLAREESIVDENDDRHFYHIRVKNKGRSTAYNCKVDIEFREQKTSSQRSIIIRNAKWAENPEPVFPQIFSPHPLATPRIVKVPHDSLLRYTWYMNIPSRSEKSFALLLKYRGESGCYAFNGQNYTIINNDLKVQSRLMDRGEYIAKIIVTADNAKIEGSYYIYIVGINLADVHIVPY